MEQLQEKKMAPVVIDQKQLTGMWELTKKVHNSQGVKAFGGHLLTAYTHPLTKQKTEILNVDGQILRGFMIDKITMILRPDTDPTHKLQLQWLIAHPEVSVQGATLDSRVRKNPNNSIFLKNIDNQIMDDIDEQDKIDAVIGRLSLDSGPQSIGLKRLRILLTYFNLPYFDARYINNPVTEKKFLRNKLKSWCRKVDENGNMNGLKLIDIFDVVDNYEINYKVKEMIRHNMLLFSGSIYKFNNVPIGTNIETVVEYFKNNPNIYNEAESKLLPLLKKEGFKD